MWGAREQCFFVSSFDCHVRIVGAAGRYYRPAASPCVLQRLSPINLASFSRSSSADDDDGLAGEAAAVLKAAIPKTRLNKLLVVRGLGAAGPPPSDQDGAARPPPSDRDGAARPLPSDRDGAVCSKDVLHEYFPRYLDTDQRTPLCKDLHTSEHVPGN